MIDIIYLKKIVESGITYGGKSGSKKGILLDNERWFLKYPKSTKSMERVEISYTTTSISEYIGSHIYNLLGIKSHETKIGIANNKVVVICKDFLNKSEIILDYNSLKNDYSEEVEKKLEEISTSSYRYETDLNELVIVMNNNSYFKKNPLLKERFWDMFIIDSFINNNDRNDNNWGLILNQEQMITRICPVYDNGAAFYNKISSDKAKTLLSNDFKFKQAVYDSAVSAFAENGKIINPLKYIETMNNEECNKALLRIFPNINLNEIRKMIYEIPDYYHEYEILDKTLKDFYYKTLEFKYENIFKPIYNRLINKTK